MNEPSTRDRIHRLLKENGVSFRILHHEPTRTSADSARVRGEDLAIGAKAIVMKVGDTFRLFVLCAHMKLDAKAIKNFFKARGGRVKRIRFATEAELMALTGLVPGSVPPFGRPILDLDLYVDPALFRNEWIAFNAGSLTDSVIMPSADYRRIAEPILLEFAIE